MANGETGVQEHEAILMVQRATEVAAAIALGDGLTRQTVAIILHDLADMVEGANNATLLEPIVHDMGLA